MTTENDRIIGQQWFVVRNDIIGGWSVANVDKPTAVITNTDGRERVLADFWSFEVAKHAVMQHNAALTKKNE